MADQMNGGVIRGVMIGLVSLMVAAPVSAEEVWQVTRETDQLRDITNVSASAPSSSDNKSFISVACKEGKIKTSLMLGEYLGTGGNPTVRYRFDKGKITTETWRLASNFETALAADSKEMADKLSQHKQVVFEVEAARRKAYQRVFSLEGSTDSIQQVYEACGI